jgi:hypothetical protein
MAESKRGYVVPGVYRIPICPECEVNLDMNFHESSCRSLPARIERGEVPSDGQILAKIIAEWREKNGMT